MVLLSTFYPRVRLFFATLIMCMIFSHLIFFVNNFLYIKSHSGYRNSIGGCRITPERYILSVVARRRFFKLPFILFPIVPFILTTGIGALPADAGGNERILVLAPQSTASVPFILMAREDHIEGVDIVTELFINHPQALARVLKGDADFIFTGTSSGWENHLDGGPLVMVNTGVWGVSYLVGKDPAIRDFSDLRGKRVSLPFPGSPLDFQTRAILRKTGIDPEKDLTLSYSPFTQSVPMLLMGQLDAAPLPEPLATDAAMNRGLLRLVDYKKAWAQVSGGNEHSPQVSLFAAAEKARRHGPFIVMLVDEWRRVTERVTRDPAAAAGTCADALALPIPVVSAATEKTLFLVPPFDEHRRMVLAYYEAVKNDLPGKRGELGRDFFFPPPDTR
jgi:NitT/TauT family transport system substrate-binding protein